jgi:IclR family transcriptional regulator, acetate operon repressor
VHRLLGTGPLTRYTDKTITDRAMLREEIRRIKATGVGTHDSEFIDASVALAVPVADARGRVYAALAVHAPSSRMSLQSAMKHVGALRQAAKAIASILTPASTRRMKTTKRSRRARRRTK